MIHSTTTYEDAQNFYNWSMIADKVPVQKRKRFLASKIHKLKKLLKLRSNSVAHHKEVSLEERQNAENEKLEHKYLDLEKNGDAYYYKCEEEEENCINENWENWDACYQCANGPSECEAYCKRDFSLSASHSICYVFMPGQAEPVPVKLRTARIPGGVMWISYRPDVDIYAGQYSCSYTSAQIPEAQRPILV